MLVLTICLAVAAGALAIWWLNSLNGLPDIGDPFDVAAFRTFSLPDDQNAFTFFRRAWKSSPVPTPQQLVPPMDSPGRRGSEVPRVCRGEPPGGGTVIKGAEQADGISGPVGEPLPERYPDIACRPRDVDDRDHLRRAVRRQERGDMAGAWDCYRAVLRMTIHVRRRERLRSQRVNLWLPVAAETSRDLGGGSEDHDPPGSTRPGGGRRVPAQARVGCVHTQDRVSGTHAISGPAMSLRSPEQIEEEWTYRLGDMQLPIDMVGSLPGARRFLARARTQPACHSIALRQLARARGNPRRTQAGRPSVASTSQRPVRSKSACRCITSALMRRPGPRAVTAGGGKLAGHDQRRQAAFRNEWLLAWPDRSSRDGTGISRTRHHCWPGRSIAASAAPCRLPTKPWSGPISRACPTTARPTWPMR